MKRTLVIAVAGAVAALLTAKAADAKENWKTHCAKCHGEDGKGQTKMGQKAGCKDYSSAKVQAEMKDDKMFKAVKDGLKEGDKTVMQPYAEKLKDDEIKALIAHIRTLKK